MYNNQKRFSAEMAPQLAESIHFANIQAISKINLTLTAWNSNQTTDTIGHSNTRCYIQEIAMKQLQLQIKSVTVFRGEPNTAVYQPQSQSLRPENSLFIKKSTCSDILVANNQNKIIVPSLVNRLHQMDKSDYSSDFFESKDLNEMKVMLKNARKDSISTKATGSILQNHIKDINWPYQLHPTQKSHVFF